MEILIVDGSPDMTDVLEQMLGMMGHQARAARNSASLRSALGECKFDACLLDLDHSMESPTDLLTRLRGQSATLCAVGWGASKEQWRATARMVELDGFLVKPASFEMIVAVLEGRPCPACAQPLDTSHAHPSCQWSVA